MMDAYIPATITSWSVKKEDSRDIVVEIVIHDAKSLLLLPMVSIIKLLLPKTATLTLNISLTAGRIWMKPTPLESSCENLKKKC